MTDAQRQLAATVREDPDLRRVLFTSIAEMREVAVRRLVSPLTWEETCYERGAVSSYDALITLFDKENRDARSRQTADHRAGHN